MRNDRSCTIEGCEQKHYSSGLCKKHYDKREYSRRYHKSEVCEVEGCGQPRYTTKGTRYHLCEQHQAAYWKAIAADRQALVITPTAYNVMVIDWERDTLAYGTFTVTSNKDMPATYGELLKVMAQHAQSGGLVARPQAFHETDLGMVEDVLPLPAFETEEADYEAYR